MTSRGRGGSMSDWDPMRDDFNDTNYNAQYPDEDANETVQLDHTKLYITKLPAALSQEGFVDLFSKYGRVVHSYFSRDPLKRYAFVTFETAGEARIAMMKLNKTEPFNMSIFFAHSKNPTKTQQSQPNMDRSQSNTDRQINRQLSSTEKHNHSTSIREDSASVSSRGRKPRNVEDDHVNGNEDDDETEDSDVGHDPKLGYNLEKLKLQRLQIMDQQLQVQQRMLLHQQRMKSNTQTVTKRRLLPDGRSIQISQDNERSFTAGGGDSRNIPGLQCEASRRCVSCGAAAGLYCAGCRVTPYCAERCQRRDWDARHRAVCHNLARSSTDERVQLENNETDAPVTAPVPLRRPHSPKKSPREQHLNDSVSDRAGKNVIPHGEKHAAHQQAQQRRGNPPPTVRNGNHSTQNRVQNRLDSNKVDSQGQRPPLRQPVKQPAPNPKQTQAEPKPTQPEPKPTQAEPKPIQAEPKPTQAKPKPQVIETKSEPNMNQNSARPGSLGDVTPRKPLVPASYVIEKLPVGATFLAEAVSPASECGSSQVGHVCLTLHEEYGDKYDQLCEDFKAHCQKDNEEYTPRIGETFAYFCEEDGFWYRARCLSRTRAALLDAGRVVSLAPAACRRLPPAYAAIPEFMALLKTTELSIGVNLTCTVVNVSSSGLRVSVDDGSGKSFEVDATRWIPEVEHLTDPQHSLRKSKLHQPTTEPQTAKPALVEPSSEPQEPSKKLSAEPPLKEPRHEVRASVGSRLAQDLPCPPLIPANYLLEKLPVGATFLAEAVSPASECGSSQVGHVCLTLHEEYGDKYDQLCEDFKAHCQKDNEEYTPRIGETFAYFCEEDGFWYRARCLCRTRAALLDAGRVVSLAPAACRRLPPAYAAIPEFMALLKTTELSIGVNLTCTVLNVSSRGLRVSVEDGSGSTVQVDATRWIPEVEHPIELPSSKPTTVAPVKSTAPVTGSAAIVPEVPRPDVSHNALYLLLDVTSLRRACVRPCEPRLAAMFDAVLQDTVQYGINATPLTEPPHKGQTVVAKFIEDGTHYRALVKRVNVAMNKYLIEYIEYGNEEIVPLERLYPCPPKLQLDVKPAQASFVKLSEREPVTLTRAAIEYINTLKENVVQFVLTIPGGVKTAPSGSLVNLVTAKGCDPCSKKIEELCTPEWKKLLERGGDVIESECRFYSHLKYSSVPTSRPFTLRITFCDAETLMCGAVSGYEKGDKAADLVYGELTRQITEYCESPLCREAYLPKIEELCLTNNKRVNKWVRSVLVSLPQGPGSRTASVMHIDYGDLEDVPVSNLRKLLPEFVDEYPALAQHFEIKNFPHDKVTRSQLERGMQLMRMTADGTGELRVARCHELDDKMYEVEAPDLIAALTE